MNKGIVATAALVIAVGLTACGTTTTNTPTKSPAVGSNKPAASIDTCKSDMVKAIKEFNGGAGKDTGTKPPSCEGLTEAQLQQVATDAVIESGISDTSAPAATADKSATVAFGATKTYTDGLQITVSKGTSFKPSQYSVFNKKFKSFVKYTVTIVNGTGAVFDPSMFYATAQSANVEADEVFDSENGFAGSPDTKLLKGREAKFVIGFGVTNPKDIVLEVSPSFEHDSILYN